MASHEQFLTQLLNTKKDEYQMLQIKKQREQARILTQESMLLNDINLLSKQLEHPREMKPRGDQRDG